MPFHRPQKSVPQGSQEEIPEGQVQEARAAFQFGPRTERADFFFGKREKERWW